MCVSKARSVHLSHFFMKPCHVQHCRKRTQTKVQLTIKSEQIPFASKVSWVWWWWWWWWWPGLRKYRPPRPLPGCARRCWGSGGAAKITHRHNLTSFEAALSIVSEENNTPWGENMKCVGDGKQKCVFSPSIKLFFLGQIPCLAEKGLGCPAFLYLLCKHFCFPWLWT